ncbi:hypothetical protein BKP35_07685 [Anaerobacillus arseniciselenatis]|uniref:PpiC domain-containing protein n=1 Tax=Anaerobacillus arseniciselenatis TaxID=85682 RepID=A0A1S2LNZ7_9BACI|nr:peptidylprolyl isomerase [Anaerobacillus arseniciselenatis]OIJ14074.1 hypothetical protein BKP35_07685 [Anaerobacillus arseniciselenatis]
MYLRKIIILFVALILLAAVTACNNSGDTNDETLETGLEFPVLDRSDLGDNIVAVYEGGEVTGNELATFLAVQAFLNPEAPVNDLDYRQGAIQELVMEKVIGAKSSGQWAGNQVEVLWEQIEYVYGDKTIQDAYYQLKIDEDDVRNSLYSMFQIEAHFRDNITEEELLGYYEEVSLELTVASFSHILIATQEMSASGEMVELRTDQEAIDRANDLYEQLLAGADLNELATETTDDEGSLNSGGRYEEISVVELVPEFQEALLEQKLDEIGEPVKTDFGYHIIRVEELHQIPFEEIEEELVSSLVFEKYMDYYFNALAELNIEVTL